MADRLRPIDNKRLEHIHTLKNEAPVSDDIWFVHTILAQCFLPYRDPKTERWHRKNGDFGISLVAGDIQDPKSPDGYRVLGLPYGTKPRLFQSYVCTQAIKQQSPVIPVERSMTSMMHELGMKVTGGKQGTIAGFQDQTLRFARCHFTIIAPGGQGQTSYIEAQPVKKIDLWFPQNADQRTFWKSEIVLSDDYFYSLKHHAVPYDFRGLRIIQNKPRAQDIYLWMTQRLCRISNRPLKLTWQHLYDMFGGTSTLKEFKRNLPNDMIAAISAYPDARVEPVKEGYLFRTSPPPIPKTQVLVRKP